MGPESFVVYSDAWSSGSSRDIPGNCRCPRCHEWSLTECQKEHTPQVGYSHDAREMVQVVVELPLREELLRLCAVSSEYVRGLPEKSVISPSGVAWGWPSCCGGVSTPTAATTSSSTAASAATPTTAQGVFSSGSLYVGWFRP